VTNFRIYDAIASGGVLGALVRWAIADVFATGSFPWATLIVNLVGCGLLGAFTARDWSLRTRAALGVGFCGGLTTFSTFGLEAAMMLDDGDVGLAAAYVAASTIGGLAVFVAGRANRPDVV
jgi:CrcB protein